MTANPYSLFRARITGVCAGLLLPFLTVEPSRAQQNGNFTLTNSATTSAGVFTTSGTLVKTLWSNVRYAAGTHAFSWDGKDQNGQSVPAGSYQTKVIAHNVNYVWEGVIGNSSDSFTGANVHRSFRPIHSMAITDAGTGYYVVGYNEQQYLAYKFSSANPQSVTPVAHDDYQRSFTFVATDNTRVYYANSGSGWNAANFITAFNVANNTPHIFSSGVEESPGIPGQNWKSTIDRVSGPSISDFVVITGLAVQKTGNVLFAAHSRDNQIRRFDKISGAEILPRINVTAPTALATTPAGDLWVACLVSGAPAVVLYTNPGANPVLSTTITSVSKPLALGVSPSNILVVADGGSSEQLKAYNQSGVSQWTHGLPGGYLANGPDVASNKFIFDNNSFVAFHPDGSFWVGEGGNTRAMHFSANRTYLEQIIYMSVSYLTTADPNNPTRVFCDYREFAVDYSKPLAQSWTLIKNWKSNLTNSQWSGFGEGFKSVVTLNNGRTYGLITRGPEDPNRKNVMVELPASGHLRFTPHEFPLDETFYEDGSLRIHTTGGGVQKINQRTLSGFDANGNPQWNAATVIATAPTGNGDPYYRYNFSLVGPRFPVTSSDIMVFYDGSRGNQGWHLGGVKRNATQWAWKASPSGRFLRDCDPDGDGHGCGYQQGIIINPNGSFDTQDSKTTYAGNVAMAQGRSIVYGYHGEFWNDGQANQWLHFYDNGLFIGQFGHPNYPLPNKDNAIAGAAGNAFSPAMVTVGGKLYIWHNDESAHAGVHRWRLDGWDQIQELVVPLSTGTVNNPPSASLIGPAQGANFTAPAIITLTATASDPDGTVSKVEFFNGATKLGEDTTAPYDWAWTSVPAGSYSLTARAIDNAGAITSSSAVNITVTEGSSGSGSADGLRGEYFNGTTFNTSVLTRTDARVTFDWGNNSPAAGINADFFSARWTGKVQPKYTETYTFYTTSDDGVRLWVNNQLIIDNWTLHAPTENSGTITLSSGQQYDIKLEYFESQYGAVISLGWSSPSQVKETIPQSQLFSGTGGGGPPPVNVAPSVTFTSPANGSSFTAPANISLTASASDGDGNVTKVEFFNNGLKVGEDTSSPYSFTLNNLAAGNYVMFARATDNLGATTDSPVTSITVTSAGGPAGTLVIDGNNVRQSIDGFGVSINGSAWWLHGFKEPYRSQILSLLYSVTNGIGLSISRVEMTADNHDAADTSPSGAGALQPLINSIQPSEGVWNWTGDECQVWMMQQIQQRFGGVKFYACPWSPPPWMKVNNNYMGNTRDGNGNYNAYMREDKYQALADYFSRYVREYKTRFGIDIYGISIANEPTFPAHYQGCLWTPAQMVNFIKNNLRPTFLRDGVTAQVIAPENAGWSETHHQDAILADPTASAAVGIVAQHGYEEANFAYYNNVKAANKRLWQTEVSDLSGQNNSSIQDGIRWVKNLHGHMTESEANAWMWYWSNTPGDWSLGLIFQHYTAQSFTPKKDTYRNPKRLWTIGNYSRFIRPGYVRLNATKSPINGVLTSAYKDPVSGQLVVVVINDTDSSQTFNVSLSGINGLTALKPYVTSATQDLEPQQTVAVSGNSFPLSVVARSVTTFVKSESPLPAAPIANTYLSDLEWVSASTSWIEPVQKDRTSPGGWYFSSPITLSGTTYPKGLGFTAPASVIYNLDAKAASFHAVIGMTKGSADNAVRFQVWADDQLLQDLGVVRGNEGGRSVTVNVAGKRRLKLVAVPAGSGTPQDNQAVWADARVTYGGGPSINLTSPANNATFVSGSNLSLGANATTTSGTISQVQFFSGTTLLGTDTTSPYTYAWNNVPAGAYTLTATATDSQGATATSAPIAITVTPPVNQLPSVSIVSPVTNATFAGPANITINATATDPDGTISKVEFYQGSTKLGEDLSSPFSFTWSNVVPGQYNLSAVATDNAGAAALSSVVSVSVTKPGITSPKQNANGSFQLTIAGAVGRTNLIQASTDLENWTTLANIINVNGTILFTDPQASNYTHRFYRSLAESVYTENAVGFTRVTVPPGYSIIANQLDSGVNRVGDLFVNVPNGTSLSKFRNSTADFAVNSYYSLFGHWDDDNQPFAPGEAALIKNPTANSFNVTFVGQVPQGNLSNPMAAGYSMVSSQVPQTGLLQNRLAFPPSGGDIVYLYRNGGYLISRYFSAFNVWDSEPNLSVGEGFFLFKAQPSTWTRSFSVNP